MPKFTQNGFAAFLFKEFDDEGNMVSMGRNVTYSIEITANDFEDCKAKLQAYYNGTPSEDIVIAIE